MSLLSLPVMVSSSYIVVNCADLCPLSLAGVWDVMSNVEVIDFVRQRIAQEMQIDVV